MKPLPTPVKGGRISDLKPFINHKNDDDWILMLSWLIGVFNPKGPFPLLALNGEQGSAKSTTSRLLKELIDPNTTTLRSLPRSESDLMISAKNSWLLNYDNLSKISPSMSDAFCRLATGGGISTRTLYTNTDETILNATRPILINGIGDLATKADLLDRALIVNLPRIPAENRKLNRDYWDSFNKVKPGIFGALLDHVSFALKNRSNVNLDFYPRMADFAQWVTAAEPMLPWGKGKFMSVYSRNIKEAAQISIESDSFALKLIEFIESKKSWSGTATQLLKELKEFINYDEDLFRDRKLPGTPNYLSNRLSMIAPGLRTMGISIDKKKTSVSKLWELSVK